MVGNRRKLDGYKLLHRQAMTQLSRGEMPDEAALRGHRIYTRWAEFSNQLLQSQNRQLELEANQDHLTGLLNRRGLGKQVAQIVAGLNPSHERRIYAPHFAVIFGDLNGFKALNDRYGQAGGDDILRAVGAGMQQDLRPDDTVGRYGGDEFVIVAEHQGNSRAVKGLCDRIANAVPSYVGHVNPAMLPLGISFGYTNIVPGADAATIIKRADEAAGLAKVHGLTSSVWDSQTDYSALKERKMERGLAMRSA